MQPQSKGEMQMAANRNQAFFVVGHANWGKSSTLMALTAGSFHVRHLPIGGRTFFIRRMSNDDRPLNEWIQRIRKTQWRSHLLLTLCPKASAVPFLRQLSKTHQLYFWIMHVSFTSGAIITPAEVARLRALGRVHIFNPKAQAAVRSNDLRNFILQWP